MQLLRDNLTLWTSDMTEGPTSNESQQQQQQVNDDGDDGEGVAPK